MTAVRVPFRVQTPEGPLEASVTTTEAEIAVVSVVAAARGLDDALITIAVTHATKTGTPPTCRRGCTACCHHLVPLSMIEVHAVGALVEALGDEERAAVEARFDEALEKATQAGLVGDLLASLRTGRFDRHRDWQRAHIPCPFLEASGDCGIYAQRPLACREYLVTSDPAACTDAPATARPLPLFARLSRGVLAVSQAAWPGEPDRVPLLLALQVAADRRNVRAAVDKGVALLTRLLSAL